MRLRDKLMLDKYTRHARLAPALIVALPLALATFAWFPDELTGQGFLWGLLVGGGATALLAQVSRDRGKRKEPDLFERWDGMPTTRFLRHRDAPNKVTLRRYHNKLEAAISDISMPSASEERADPSRADQTYETCVSFLREHARNRDEEPCRLVFEENCNYGFRRNLWGMKPMGISIASAGLIAVGIRAAFTLMEGSVLHVTTLIPAGAILVLLVGWTVWFTPEWVKDAAEAYAERLLATIEIL
jgi:hypothetical protein